ncbi:alpha/beta hydrolase fold domain-containing protein [Streptacidiphilus sp. P02-A3a]|uniref:alpha/beta hydrolase fold domain-containing protein n=1 Tax=Streptacidiphilus sp. P02-A3a TaxID=2704468 RepID=UPI0015FDA484|nr:alpha/beta hydrolase fold domain-containing protein [Streptacidiphilus sp. P02-A3a]QMU71731.1 alpha/beta hydrolase [Streptacidiphilus sp. P02-A3a]
MTRSQLDSVSELLQNSPLDLGGDVEKMRRVFDEMLGSAPLPDDVRTRTTELGGVPAVEVRAGAAVAASGTVLYFHGGAYAIGSAASSVGLVSEIARRTAATALTVDYRLAPEHPFPAAVGDALAAYRALLDRGVPAGSVAVTGESAGGGLALALLLAIRDAGLPQPSSATVMSPWTDLTLSGATMTTRADADPAVTRQALETRAADYLAGADPRTALASPLHADLRGLPPLLIQVGGREILLDDALRLAARAARADVPVSLRTFPGAPHVFQGFAAFADEAAQALDEVAAFITSHAQPEG